MAWRLRDRDPRTASAVRRPALDAGPDVDDRRDHAKRIRLPEAARLGPMIDEMRARPGGDHRQDRLAARAGMSLRTFERRFAAATGLPPGEWLMAERLRLAREMLERVPRAPLDDVAAADGFGSAAALRHHFRARLGTSPAAYRRAFST